MTDRREAARRAMAQAEEAAGLHPDGPSLHARAAHAPPPLDLQAQDGEPDPEAVARAIVLRQLALAPRSRQQLADKLSQRGCDPAVAERVLDRMTEVGLVDDAAYAEMLVRSRRATKGLATSALRHELRRKGVDGELIDDAVEEITPAQERVLAEELAQRRLKAMSGLEPKVQARRLAGMLARKGYSSDIVYAVVRDAMESTPDLQRD